jgi:prepilin-type N-terminal cleavage/methylation domain-containing protein
MMCGPRLQIPPRSSSRPVVVRDGFTLTELLIVIVIIGIILSFILLAAADSLRTANVKATQGLVQKLDAAMSERMEALMTVDIYPNAAHNALAKTYSQIRPTGMASVDRAQVIAMYDFIKSEVPDVFFPSGDANYPLNFAAQPYPGNVDPTALYAQAYGQYMLPLGAGITYDASSSSYGAYDPTAPNGTGVFGASYAAAAGIYKNLGYYPAGYDGVDNNQDGLIDELAEGVDGNNSALVTTNLANHTHKTARSEMLYAILVEGMGPLGSAFAPDDFTSREVADTDGDGLPEFIDAWGEPLQFYRWPIFYHSDIQRGFPNATVDTTTGPYNGPFDSREQDPLDPNQQLLNPSWLLTGQGINDVDFRNYFNSDPSSILSDSGFPASGIARLSTGAWAFQTYFHTLVEPMSFLRDTSAATVGMFWDRTNNNAFRDYQHRRAYFTKFLILSGGPDRVPGVGMLGFDYSVTGDIADGTGTAVPITASNLIQIENTAAAIDPNYDGPRGVKQWNSATGLPLFNPNSSATNDHLPNGTTIYLQQNAGLDDVSNQSGQASAGSNP